MLFYSYIIATKIIATKLKKEPIGSFYYILHFFVLSNKLSYLNNFISL